MSDITTLFTKPDYLNVDPAITAQRKAFLRTVWQSFAPEIELRYGVYGSTVAAPSAIFSQAILESLDEWRKHTQLETLLDPTLDIDVKNQYLSLFLDNYRVQRKDSEQSIGLVKLVFATNTTYGIGPTDTFTAKGIVFRPTTMFSIFPVNNRVVAAHMQALQPQDDGTFCAVIELRSDTTAVAANLPAGTQLVQTDGSITDLLDVVVVETFVGAVVEDTAATLIPKLVHGITAPVLTSRGNIAAKLKTVPFAEVREVSVIGCGDAESVRDRHGLFNLSQGGKGDLYVRTSGVLHTKQLTKLCKLVERVDDHTAKYGCWLGRDDASAAYNIISVQTENSNDILKIVREVRSFDTSGVSRAPDIVTYAEAAFTAYQTIYLEFLDTKTDRHGAELPQTAAFVISYNCLPQIQELQNFVIDKNHAAVMGDLLVKAAVPCIVHLSFTVGVQEGQEDPDLNVLVNTVVNTVSTTGFMNSLPASILIEALQQRLATGMFINEFSMVGQLWLPVGMETKGQLHAITHTTSAAKEVLCYDIPPYATANTICFFTDSAKIAVRVEHHKSVARLIT